MSQPNIAEMTSKNRPTLLMIPREIREEIDKHLTCSQDNPITIQCRDGAKDPPPILLTRHILTYEAAEYF